MTQICTQIYLSRISSLQDYFAYPIVGHLLFSFSKLAGNIHFVLLLFNMAKLVLGDYFIQDFDSLKIEILHQ